MIVTHDLAEALEMADQLAILRDNCLIQAGRPLDLLASPCDPFVAEFLGADRALRRLDLIQAGSIVEPGTVEGEPIAPEMSLQQALAGMLATGVICLPVGDGGQRVLSLKAVQAAARLRSESARRNYKGRLSLASRVGGTRDVR